MGTSNSLMSTSITPDMVPAGILAEVKMRLQFNCTIVKIYESDEKTVFRKISFRSNFLYIRKEYREGQRFKNFLTISKDLSQHDYVLTEVARIDLDLCNNQLESLLHQRLVDECKLPVVSVRCLYPIDFYHELISPIYV